MGLDGHMVNVVRVVGIHPVPGDEPVHLIEIELTGDVDAFNFGEVTQEQSDQPRESWQAVYDERELGRHAGRARFVFFFHYLDLKKPLLTPFGAAWLPEESEIPKHLQHIEYDQP
jgi:hypothetical protein